MAEQLMTVHNFVLLMRPGVVVKVPTTCTYTDLAYYGATRFGYRFVQVGADSMKRTE